MLIYAADTVSERLLLTLTSYIWRCWDASSIKKHLETHTWSSLSIYRSLCICPLSGSIRSTLPRSLRQQFQMTSGMETSMANQKQGTASLPLTDKANRQQSLWADLHSVCAQSFITNRTADREPWKEKISLNYAHKHPSGVGILVWQHTVLKEDTGLELHSLWPRRRPSLVQSSNFKTACTCVGIASLSSSSDVCVQQDWLETFCLSFFIYSLFAFSCNTVRFKSLTSAWNYVILLQM